MSFYISTRRSSIFAPVIALVASLTLAPDVSGQASEWAVSAGGALYDGGSRVAAYVDEAGDSYVYVTGQFSDTAIFGPTTLISEGERDTFLAKLGPSGEFLWVVQVGGALDDGVGRVAVDEDGNIYFAGGFSDTETFGSTELTSAGEHDVFVAKLDPSGAFLWVVGAGGALGDGSGGVAVDEGGNIYVAGSFRGTADFGSTELTSAGEGDAFVAKLDSSGGFLWAVQAGGALDDKCRGIAVDAAGNSYVTGYFHDTATFGLTEELSSDDSTDVFVAKLDPWGEFLWAVRAGGESSDVGVGVAVDGAGNSRVTGKFRGNAAFGSTELTCVGYRNVFVAALDPTGEFLWAVRAGGRDDRGGGVAIDEAGNSYVSGDFRDTGGDTITFGSITLSGAGLQDVFLAKLDPWGAFLWAIPAGGWSQEFGRGLAIDADGNGYVTGLVSGTATFGSTTLTSEGDRDVFVWKLSVVADYWCTTVAADAGTPSGMVTDGSFIDTHMQDDAYEALTEELSNASRRGRSLLEHIWTFDILPGLSYTFFVDAHHTINSEGDDFVFTYSVDGTTYSGPMVTVTKTADDSILQSFVFPEDIAGTVYIRVEDTDRTKGSNVLDTLFVDEMCIRTSLAADPLPPAAPGNLTATPGDTAVSLDWDDNIEPDLDGYKVYRPLDEGVSYAPLATSPSSDYVDSGLTNGATYYYIVTAVDHDDNESADSVEVMATPQGGGGGGTMHVAAIIVDTVNEGGGMKHGRAMVTVVDDIGAPVAGADVTGTFSGSFNETVSATTGPDGVAVLLTVSSKKGGVSILFCVDDIAHDLLPYEYDPNANVETCDSN